MEKEIVILGLALIYKFATLLTGLAFTYMGYRLFLADKTNSAGDFKASSKDYLLSLTGGAPGVFFCLCGTVLIVFSMFKSSSYSQETRHYNPATLPTKSSTQDTFHQPSSLGSSVLLSQNTQIRASSTEKYDEEAKDAVAATNDENVNDDAVASAIKASQPAMDRGEDK